MNKISAVYKIVNTVTGDFYVGSSRDVERRWNAHKCPSTRMQYPNNQMYRDMQVLGIDKFRFQILCPVMPEYLKQVEQECIDMLHPTYNKNKANGRDIERYKEWFSCDKGREYMKAYLKEYRNQLCSFNGETLTLGALVGRFHNDGIKHPALEAKKYLIK